MYTIIIPTKNRSDFLTRLLNYFADTNYMHLISIGDSSNVQHIQRIKETIKKLENKLNIIYREYPGLNVSKCTKQLIRTISTPYASFLADDDFLVQESIEKCINFLELHSEYIACHGIGAVFRLKQIGPYGQFDNIWEYLLPSREEETASKRFLNHLSDYSNNLFSVYRTSILKIMFENDAIPDRSLGNDLLPSCLAAILGKCKKLDCFHIIHHTHKQQQPIEHYDWITSQNWFPSYQIFYNTLSEELMKQDGIAIDKAHAVVKQAFWSHMRYKSNRHFQNRYGTLKTLKRAERIKEEIKHIPAVKNMWNVVKKIRYKIFPSNEVNMHTLLNSRSPYHHDFMPVYRAVAENL